MEASSESRRSAATIDVPTGCAPGHDTATSRDDRLAAAWREVFGAQEPDEVEAPPDTVREACVPTGAEPRSISPRAASQPPRRSA